MKHKPRSKNIFWHIRMSSAAFYLIFPLIFGCQDNQNFSERTAKEWPVYLGDKQNSHYSPLEQINTTNVQKLKVAWEYSTGDADSLGGSQIQCNPIIVDGILYGTSPKLKVFAIKAATGKEIWRFDPSVDTDLSMNVNRGLTYWENKDDQRILFTAGAYLFSINARTGLPVKSFGNSGKVSLKEELGEWAGELYVVSTTPGIVYGDLLIIGTRVSEGAQAAPGYIRAYNIKTGAVAWTFHTIPKPGEFGYDTWPEDAYKRIGGVNSWAGMALDEKRGIVFVPTGSAAYDFYGGNRKGANLFANCLLALNAATGERIWHFQTVHHDIWDRDLPSPPNLIQVTQGGKKIDAVAQITKSGFVFLFNRETGKLLFDIEERPVKKSDLEGEESWPTQPFPVKPAPFSGQWLIEDNITDLNKESHNYIAGILKNVRTGEQFIPPSIQGTVIYPGFDGGGEWGGAAIDPENGILYTNANEMAWILTMIPLKPYDGKNPMTSGQTTYITSCAMCHGPEMHGDKTGTYPSLKGVGKKYTREQIRTIVEKGKNFMPSWKHLGEDRMEAVISYVLGQQEVADTHTVNPDENAGIVPFTHTGYNRFLDPFGYPAMKPPWGTLSAIDMNEGKILWQVPLGEFAELTAKGIPKTGTENYGGPIATAGNLLFIGASKDEHFRAFDRRSGQELWKYKLPAGGYATPATYEAGGKQYVVIACGGGKMGTKSGSSYIAFALP
ncbi:MAG: PQQ-binding-like beta-propeller repeat protein [Flavobacteriaceae bacterium]|nr:PQQ-binding-like beta-propeller repeat protein [Flavobacteriaceae bacterium]